jgi:hypothetical protein
MNVSSSRIQILQQYARIGIDADPSKLEMRQPKALLEIRTERPRLDIESPKGQLSIDQTKAWDALALGGHLKTSDRIYGENKRITLDAIGRIVQDGNRLAAIHLPTNAIADLAEERSSESVPWIIVGPAAFDNVDIQYVARKPRFEPIRGTVSIDTSPNRPEINFTRGNLDIHMLQYNKVEIIPPQIDLRV